MTQSSTQSERLVEVSASTKKKKIGIITAEWNSPVTSALEKGCLETLKRHNIPEDQIISKKVPGSFEIPLGAQYMAELGFVHAVICLGCLIRGETPHFHYIAETVTQKIGDLNTHYSLPFIYGILTVENEEQAKARAGGEHGNKGEEAALAAIQMLELRQSFQSGKKPAGFH